MSKRKPVVSALSYISEEPDENTPSESPKQSPTKSPLMPEQNEMSLKDFKLPLSEKPIQTPKTSNTPKVLYATRTPLFPKTPSFKGGRPTIKVIYKSVQRVVRIDENNKKYIIVNKQKVFLSSILRQYKYV